MVKPKNDTFLYKLAPMITQRPIKYPDLINYPRNLKSILDS